MKKTTPSPQEPSADRIAKVIARAGLCSRRDAEAWIAEGRVKLNGKELTSPAITVGPEDIIEVDGQPLPSRERTRLWLFHKPKGTVTTTFDPEGRQTVFEVLPDDLPRVMTIGRLDINTEGLLLLTNDGGLARILELPTTGWLRRYRVRAHGEIDQARLDALKDGVAIDGILYGSVEATLDRKKGDNVWLTVGLREGKNREVKTILAHLGLEVNRLIRVSFGPFQLGELAVGTVDEVPRRVLRDQLGERLATEAGADFELREGDRAPVQLTMNRGERAPAGRTAKAAADRADKPQRTADRGGPRTKAMGDVPPRRPTGETAPSRRHGRDVAPTGETRPPRQSRDKLILKTAADPAARRGRLSRQPAEGESEAPARAYRTGKSFEVDRKPREGTAPARVRGDRRPAETSEAPGRTAHAKPAGKRPPSGDRPTGGPKGSPAGKPRGRDADRRR